MIKRLFDIVASFFGLLIFSPVIAIVAWQISRKLGSPVLFRQVRPGKDGKPFEIIKFRTMLDAVDANGDPLPDEERMTPFGNFLRSTSLDELPELWNVLKGNMSLVGPRPLLMEYLPLYSAEQYRRHEARLAPCVLQAMSMGRAIITTDAPGCRETVIDGENGFLVSVKDANALAMAMLRFIEQPELIAAMGKRSREMAEQKYDVEIVNRQMFEGMGL